MSKLFTIKVTEKNTQYIKHLEQSIQGIVKPEVNWQSKLLAYNIKKKYFASRFGTYSRTSALAKTIEPIPADSITPSTVVGGVEMGGNLSYAHRFIGPAGQTSTITGKKGKLAIPLNASAHELLQSGTPLQYYPLTRRKNTLYVKNFDGSVGAKMYVLLKSVTIRARIDPQAVAFQNTIPVLNGLRRAVYNGAKVLNK
jgi:hypothetical protein